MTRHQLFTFAKAPNGREIQLSNNTHELEVDMLFRTTNNTIVVGYLKQDPDCESPEEGDGNGRVLYRNGSRAEYDKFLGTLGLDSDGVPKYEQYIPWSALLQRAKDVIQKSHDGVLDSAIWITARIVACGEYDRDEQLIAENALQFVFNCMDSIEDDQEGYEMLENLIPIQPLQKALWDEAIERGEILDPLLIPLNVYEHGGIAFKVSDEPPSAKADAIWIPDPCAIENFVKKDMTLKEKRQAAKEYAHSCVEEYTNWRNGDCWMYFIDSFDMETGQTVNEEEGCGIIGRKYAEEELAEAFNNFTM